MFDPAKLNEFVSIEYQEDNLIDGEGEPLQWRVSNACGDWQVEEFDSYRSEWYGVEGQDKFVTRAEAILRLQEVVEAAFAAQLEEALDAEYDRDAAREANNRSWAP